MYTLYKFHFLNGISEINQLFDDILIIWPAPVYIKKIQHIIKILKHHAPFIIIVYKGVTSTVFQFQLFCVMEEGNNMRMNVWVNVWDCLMNVYQVCFGLF